MIGQNSVIICSRGFVIFNRQGTQAAAKWAASCGRLYSAIKPLAKPLLPQLLQGEKSKEKVLSNEVN